MTRAEQENKVSVPALRQMKHKGRAITMLTAYDATFARLIDDCGIDILLVGDSLGMVIQGRDNTLAVTIEHMIYHTRAVARGVQRAHVVADMPFMSYQSSDDDGMRNAGRLIKEGCAEAVKLEGGRRFAALIRRISEAGIPVMGHIGLTPQSIHAMGGYKVQGRKREQARQLVEDALALQDAGVYSLVLEGVPLETARQITEAVTVPTIGIGAGPHCDGQVLVIYDLLGMNDDFAPKFVKRYENLADRIRQAVRSYATEVRQGAFPTEEHSFTRARKDEEVAVAAPSPADGERTAVATPRPAARVAEAGGTDRDAEERLAETIPLYPGVGRRR